MQMNVIIVFMTCDLNSSCVTVLPFLVLKLTVSHFTGKVICKLKGIGLVDFVSKVKEKIYDCEGDHVFFV